jgi:hypothetical protein
MRQLLDDIRERSRLLWQRNQVSPRIELSRQVVSALG